MRQFKMRPKKLIQNSIHFKNLNLPFEKIVVILLLLICGSATMSATIHLHYCMNKIVGWALWHNEKEECGGCGIKEDKTGCCKNEQKHFKSKANHHNAATAAHITFKPAPAIVNPIPDFYFQAFKKVTESFSINHAPLNISNTRLHILLCVYFI